MTSHEPPTDDSDPNDREDRLEGETEFDPVETALSKIGPWRVIRKLGAGGMGTVYLGRHEETDQEAAVKVLSAALAREGGTVERFLREIETMSQLRGRHIVSFFDSGKDMELDQLYFAMEYVPGETLADWIRRDKRLPWDQVIDIALQICTALKSAHVAGIIHRDLKPSNLLIGEDGLVKLTDFGVAQVFASQRLTVTGGVIGTAEYMSPEQAEGRRATKKSDLYSLGAVMYVMLTGRPPFTGKTSLDIIRKLQATRFDRPSLYVPEIPRTLEDVVCTLLEKNPDDRYSDAHIVALRLTEVIRRVEMAARADSEAEHFATSRLEAPTAAATDTADGETGVGGSRGPSPATMMRDVFRAEIERDNAQGPIGRALDNTWVLTGLLALVVTSGIVWFQNASTDDATDDVTELSTEAERFWHLARVRRRERDFASEQRLLIALRDVLGGAGGHDELLELVDDRLTALEKFRRDQAEDFQLARAALDRAEQLIQKQKWDEASRIVTGILELYGTEPGAAAMISEAESLVKRIASSRDDAE